MALKRKSSQNKKAASVRPTKRQHVAVLDDDADQDISDDGEIPQSGDGADEEEHGNDDGSSESSDEDEDAATMDVDFPSNGAPPEPPKPSGWKAPTTDELTNLKEAGELFKSNTFKFKIEALLPQIQPKSSSYTTIQPLLHALYQHFGSLSSLAPQHPLQAARKLRKKGVQVLYPYPEPKEDTNWKVAFEKPSNVQVVGSWAHRMSVIARDGLGVTVDMALEMPSSLFQEKDYLDSRFFHKRAFYLAVVASSLIASDLDTDVQYEALDQNVRRSTLLLRPKPGKFNFKKLNVSIRILLSVPSEFPISLSRLSPTHSNIRPTDLPSSSAATPLYNNDVLLATTPSTHLLQVYAATKEISALKEAVALLRVWANQRGYGRGDKTVAGFESLGGWWGLVLAYLVWGDEEGTSGAKRQKGKRRKTIGRGLSSYQMFRAAMDFFSTHDFVTEVVRVRTTSGTKPSHYESSGVPTFAGPSSMYNFLAGVPLGSLELLRRDARLTLQVLDHPSVNDSFELLFMRDLRDMQLRFDTVIRLDISRAKLPVTSVDHSSQKAALVEGLGQVLRQALGTRAKLISFFYPSSSSFPISQAHSSTSTSGAVIEIGILFDPQNAPRLVDHGPPAEDTEGCEQFRKFWGDKAELRRFKDGRIVESVVWELTGKPVDERLQIPGRIVRYIVERHFAIPAEDITLFDAKYDRLLSIPDDIAARYSSVAPRTTPESIQRLLLDAYDNLVKQIKAMEDLPISLLTASPDSEALRYSAIFPTLPVDLDTYPSLPDCTRYIPVVEMVLQFERSTLWPDDLEAIQKIKMALFDAIAQALLKQDGVKVSIALDQEERPTEDHVSLEILLPSGFAFRARIQHDREQTLFDRTISDVRGVPDYKRKQAQAALDRYEKRFVSGPQHHAAIHTLHHRYPTFSHATRLFKRWLSAHWLAPHLSSELAELICAYVYLNPGAHEVPCSGPSGFSRCISLLAGWDWMETPLFVPLYSAAAGEEKMTRVIFPADKQGKANELFRAHRATDPRFSHGAWVVVTEEDPTGRKWSSDIDSIVAGRARAIAKAATEYIRKGMDSGSFDALALFQHPSDDYDFLVKLKPSVVPKYAQHITADPAVWKSHRKYANVPTESTSAYGPEPRIDFDPVQLLFQDLRRVYGDNLALFYDPSGGVAIGGVWNPLLRTPRPFRVLQGFSSMPASLETKNNKKPNIVLNEAGILAEIQRIGTGLIENIVVQNTSS